MPLDRIDAALIDALQNDARMSNKELAAAVGLAPSSCLERVRRLRADGVIRGFHADVDPRALGIQLQAMIAVRLDEHAREAVAEFEAMLMTMQEVIAVYHVAGQTDYLVHVAVRDTDHLRAVALDGLGVRDMVRDIETAVIFNHCRSVALPNYMTAV